MILAPYLVALAIRCTCNVTQRVLLMQQDHRLLQFMMKLAYKFTTVRGNILMQQPLPSLSNAFKMFYQEERHHELSSLTAQAETLTYVTDNKRSYKSGVSYPQRPGTARRGYLGNIYAENTNPEMHEVPNSVASPPITTSQYQQLIELLNK